LALAYLESLKAALLADAGINGMVDGKIYKFRPIEKSEPDLRSAVHKSLISCEVGDWSGGKLSSDPIFIVDIRSRQGTDGGAEYCSEIAKAVKELLDDGFSGVAVSQIQGEVKFEKALVAYRCRLEVFGHIKISYSLSLYPSPASPQPASTEIVFTAVASPADGLEYRFLLQGPGTGSQWRDLTGWMARNSLSWTASEQDVGSSTIKVQVRGGKNKVEQDAEATASYTITAGSGGSGSLPTISSLMPSLASPQPPGLEIELICTAADAEGNELLYKFLHQPPGASYWKDLSGWQSRNWAIWRPTLADSGTNGLKVLVIDGKHAEKGGYDASSTITYTINPGITNVLTFYKVGSDDKVYYLVGTTWTLLSDQTVSKISVASDGTIAAMDLATTALLIWTGSAWINLGGVLSHIVAISSSLVYGIGGDNNIWKNENGNWSLANINYAKYIEILVSNG
jgi:hypothetical protein